MKEIVVSIIIPVYNVEPYIPRCLDSIYNQNVDDDLFEVIVVNDGSSDNSSSVVKNYQCEHSNIILIEKENGGVSSARNLAIKRSNGRYLVFVDPDDALIQGSLNTLISYLKNNQNNPVVVMRSFNNGQIELYKWVHLFKNHSHIDALDSINKGYVRGSVCGCSFLKDYIIKNNILFPDGVKNSEDTIFFFHCISAANEIVFEDIKFYDVIGRNNSASQVYTKARIDSAIKSIEFVNNLLNSFNHGGSGISILNLLKYILISSLVYACSKTKGISHSYLRDYNCHGFFKVNIKGLKYKRCNIAILNLSFNLYCLLNKF